MTFFFGFSAARILHFEFAEAPVDAKTSLSVAGDAFRAGRIVRANAKL